MLHVLAQDTAAFPCATSRQKLSSAPLSPSRLPLGSAALQGELDYTKLGGDTGPLVYPAGFVYLFSWLRNITGEAVFSAQVSTGVQEGPTLVCQ
jgi:hypothetical protein